MEKYEEYDRTNRFYIALGFKEFEIFPTLWDEWNPCQIYVMGSDGAEGKLVCIVHSNERVSGQR